MKQLLLLFAASLFFTNCARKCPADINLGNLNLHNTTLSYLPESQKVNTMTFVNTTGQTLVFTNTSEGETRVHFPVETLCERGDFLDKTVQTSGFNAQTIHYYYATPSQTYTLAIDMMPTNAGSYGNVSDTIYYESMAVWGQKILAPTRVGSLSVLTDERGNSAKITQSIRDNTNRFQTIADTTLNGRHIVNALVPVNDGNQTLFVFYTKEKGIEAFTTETEVWIRQ